MANEVKSYFLAPSWCHPTTGMPGNTIALWNLVSHPQSVMPPIDVAPEVPAATRTWHDDVDVTDETTRTCRFGVWAKFLAFAGLGGADASARGERTAWRHFHAQTVVTKECYPTEADLVGLVSRGPARRFLERFRFKQPIYVVVGVKEAHGASVQTGRGGRVGGEVSAGVDLAAVGAPGVVSLGPEASVSASRSEGASFRGGSSFVYAYRLRKIRIDPALNIVKQSDPKGCVLGVEEDEDEGEAPVRVQGLEGEDFKASEALGQREMVQDDDGEVYVTVLA